VAATRSGTRNGQLDLAIFTAFTASGSSFTPSRAVLAAQGLTDAGGDGVVGFGRGMAFGVGEGDAGLEGDERVHGQRFEQLLILEIEGARLKLILQ
jgi:hypothetical protein